MTPASRVMGAPTVEEREMARAAAAALRGAIADPATMGALNAWLERYYRVSALRFLPAVSASKAITALKAMKVRAPGPSKVSA